jgi:hypothetical protein
MSLQRANNVLAPHKKLWVKNTVDAQAKEGLRFLFVVTGGSPGIEEKISQSFHNDSMLTHKFL